MAHKVATAYVHVVGRDGFTVALHPGQQVPAHLADQVTNADAFVMVDDQETPAPAVSATLPAEYDVDDIQSLRGAAKARGLSGAGTKKALADRIAAHDATS